MRFEEIFEDYTFEHWKEYYLDYKTLDKMIEKIKAREMTTSFRRSASLLGINDKNITNTSGDTNTEFEFQEPVDLKPRIRSIDDLEGLSEPLFKKTLSTSSKTPFSDEEEKDLANKTTPLLSNYKYYPEWNAMLKKQLEKLDSFYKRKLADLLKFSDQVFKTYDDMEKEKEKGSLSETDVLSDMGEMGTLGLRFGNERIIAEIYSEFLSLESFCLINMIALITLSKKLATKCKEYKSEELLKIMRVSRYEFSNIEKVKKERDRIKFYVAEHYCGGDKHEANDILRQTNEAIDVKESIIISYLFGVITSALLVMIFQLYSLFNSNQSAVFFASFSVYRFSFEVLLSFWYAAIARYVLRLKHLNYFFVLDIRPKNLGEFHQIIRVLTIGTFVYLFYFGLDLYFTTVAAGSHSTFKANFPGLFLYITVGTFLFFPKKSWLREFRFGLLKVIAECCLAPFLPVTFIHILVADCLTSMNKVFLDIVNSTCWIYQQQWETLYANYGCNYSPQIQIIILSIPYYLRLMQCLRRYYDTGLAFPNLWNALKYTFSIATIVLSNILSVYPNIPSLTYWFLTVGSISYLYNNYWDYYNDWGLFKIWHGDKIFLRQNIKFRPRTYYIMIVTNSILRLGWLASFLPKQYVMEYFNDPNLFLLITVSAEITRRFLWSIIRIENEVEGNFEKLRDISKVPTIFHFKGKKKRIQPI